jgi:hypothetical protein
LEGSRVVLRVASVWRRQAHTGCRHRQSGRLLAGLATESGR